MDELVAARARIAQLEAENGRIVAANARLVGANALLRAGIEHYAGDDTWADTTELDGVYGFQGDWYDPDWTSADAERFGAPECPTHGSAVARAVLTRLGYAVLDR
jgi:hypothetical protein